MRDRCIQKRTDVYSMETCAYLLEMGGVTFSMKMTIWYFFKMNDNSDDED